MAKTKRPDILEIVHSFEELFEVYVFALKSGQNEAIKVATESILVIGKELDKKFKKQKFKK